MTDSSAIQLRRVLQLIPHLADGEEHALSEITSVTRVDEHTLLADLSALVERSDDPGGFVEGVQVYLGARSVSVVSSYLRRPMRLTRAEWCALELGLGVLRANRPPDEHGVIDRALARLQAMRPKAPEGDHADGHADESLRYAALSSLGSIAHLAVLQRAVRHQRKVEIRYRSGSARESTTRMVRPSELVFASGMWYVVGYCERSEALRVFRLDRIESVESMSVAFDPPAASDLAEFRSAQKVFRSESSETMTVRYSPRIARWIAEREGCPLAADGSLTLEHPLGDIGWAVRHVLQYGPEAEVVGPEKVRRAVVERLERIRTSTPSAPDPISSN